MTSRIPLAVAALVCQLWAQDPTATLFGRVVDGSRSVVAGAKVEIRNTATNEVRETVSDDKGEFTTPNLPPGLYGITISKSGFQTLHGTNLELQIEQQVRTEFHLELGTITQAVTVQALAPLINTENAVKGEVVVSEQMVEIPLNGRDFTDIALLTPGVLPCAGRGRIRHGDQRRARR
jgi:hypothetical protein